MVNAANATPTITTGSSDRDVALRCLHICTSPFQFTDRYPAFTDGSLLRTPASTPSHFPRQTACQTRNVAYVLQLMGAFTVLHSESAAETVRRFGACQEVDTDRRPFTVAKYPRRKSLGY